MSQRRTGFVLDAKSMGISATRPTSPSHCSPSTSPSRGRRDSNSNQLQQPSESMVTPSTSTMFNPQSELGHMETMQQVVPHAQCNVSTDTISTDYYRCRLNRLRDLSGDTAQMNFELNNIFVKRLEEIDCLDKQKGDATNLTPQLRLVTFQEWVDHLLRVNYLMFGNMSALEEEAYNKISACFQSVRGEQIQSLDENRKLRRDICAIIKLVQNAYHKNTWNTQDMCLETLTVNQLLGVPRDQVQESESEKMKKCMKSLVNEMAAKHDEVCHLQRQLCALDEVVQTARQKIILKDQCIAQLNQQLAELTERLGNITQQDKFSEDFQPKEDPVDEQLNCDFLEGLSHRDQEENKILRILYAELNELFNLNTKNRTELIDCYKEKLRSIFKKMNSERLDTLNKLEYVRQELTSLDCDSDKTIVPLISTAQNNAPYQQILDDPDSQLLESLRQRLQSLNYCSKEMRTKYQNLEVEYKQLQANYDSDRRINQRNCVILKELADLICGLQSMEFSYNDIYTESSTENPFRTAIMNILKNNNRQEEQINSCKNETETSTINNNVKPPKTTTTTTVTQPPSPPTPTPTPKATPRGSI